jgi:predicted N-formylglutamate amidohydrolase
VPTDNPISLINAGASSPIVLMCDHASADIPAEYDNLGLPDEVFGQHVAIDIGARDMTLELSRRMDAVAIIANFSRLLIDPNRSPEQPGFVPERSDGIEIPGNQNLSAGEISHRRRHFYEPFHDTVSNQLDKVLARGQTPIVIGVHSYTPIMQGAGRPWEVGLLWNRDPRLAMPILDFLRRDPQLTVGDNQPYSGKILGHSMDEHGGRHGYANMVIEVRQDLVSSQTDARAWGNLFADGLAQVTANANLFGVRHY